MGNKKYHLLWIDDEHETTMRNFKKLLELNDFVVDSFKSFQSGIAELRTNYQKYDGVLLDAKILESENDDPRTANVKWVHLVRDECRNLPKKFQLFIFSAQYKSTIQDQTFNHVFGKDYIFMKGKDEEKLIQKIKTAVNNQPEYQLKIKIDALNESEDFKNLLKNEYLDLLKVCYDDNLGFDKLEILAKFIKQIECKQIECKKINAEDQSFNLIRSVVENIFDKMYDLEILPESIRTKNIDENKSYFSESKTILFGKHQELYFDKKFKDDNFISLIRHNVHFLLEIVNDASHDKIDLKLFVKKYTKYAKSDYLYRSCIYLLFDILYWFKDFIKEDVKNKWKVKDINNNKPNTANNKNKTEADENLPISNKNDINNKTEINLKPFFGKLLKIENDKNGNKIGYFQPVKSNDEILIPHYLFTKYNLVLNQSFKCEVKYVNNNDKEVAEITLL